MCISVYEYLCPVTVEEKGNALWADDATRKMLYTKHAFPPRNIIMTGIGSLLVSPKGIENKDSITTDILSPIRSV